MPATLIALYVVTPAQVSGAASNGLMPRGTLHHVSPVGDRVLAECTVDRVAHVLLGLAQRLPARDAVVAGAARRSPATASRRDRRRATSVTPGPSSTTIPTPSWPGMNGGEGLTGQSPLAAWMSVWHSPIASSLTSTCPGSSSRRRDLLETQRRVELVNYCGEIARRRCFALCGCNGGDRHGRLLSTGSRILRREAPEVIRGFRGDRTENPHASVDSYQQIHRPPAAIVKGPWEVAVANLAHEVRPLRGRHRQLRTPDRRDRRGGARDVADVRADRPLRCARRALSRRVLSGSYGEWRKVTRASRALHSPTVTRAGQSRSAGKPRPRFAFRRISP